MCQISNWTWMLGEVCYSVLYFLYCMYLYVSWCICSQPQLFLSTALFQHDIRSVLIFLCGGCWLTPLTWSSWLHFYTFAFCSVLWNFRRRRLRLLAAFSHIAGITHYIWFTVKVAAAQNTIGVHWNQAHRKKRKKKKKKKKKNWSGVSQSGEDEATEHPKLFSTVSQPRKWGQIVWICVACPFISSSELLSQYISCTYGD